MNLAYVGYLLAVNGLLCALNNRRRGPLSGGDRKHKKKLIVARLVDSTANQPLLTQQVGGFRREGGKESAGRRLRTKLVVALLIRLTL